MKCTRCGFENPDYLEYCQNCTAPLDGKKGDTDKEPAWGFVKAPKWDEPEFSADTVSDTDVPSDYVHARPAGRPYDEGMQAAHAAAVHTAKSAADRAGDWLDDETDELASAADEELEDFGDELEELEDDYDDLELFGEDPRSGAKHGLALGFLDKFKHDKTKKNGYGSYREYSAGRRADDLDDEIEPEDDYDEYEDNAPAGHRYSSGKRDFDFKPIIKIAAIVLAAALLALGIYFLVRGIKGCSKPKEYDPPVVEQSIDNPDVYFVTVYTAQGTNLVYETTDGTRTEYTVPSSCYAKFRVPVNGLMPGEPVEGDTYYATPRVLIKQADGTETPIAIDPIPLSVPAIGLTFDDMQDSIVTSEGSVTIKGKVDYVNAVVTVDGEQVDVASDGTFKKQLTFETAGEYPIVVEAKLPNFQIARHTFNVTYNAPASIPGEGVIQMPWEYGDYSFSQRVVFSKESIDVRGKVPAGSTVTVSTESTNATLSAVTVDDDGTFHFTINMAKPGDYTVKVMCKTSAGSECEKDIHLQRQPDYTAYIQGAAPQDYAQFSFATAQQYKLEGKIKSIKQSGDFYLAEFEMTDGHTVMLEYHPHYGSGAILEEGKSYTQIYGRSWGFGEDGIIRFYVWFIND